MTHNPQAARKSKVAIEKLYITMRHLINRGRFRINGGLGLSLRKLLLELNPEIYGSMADPHMLELDGLIYVLDRLPKGIEDCSYIFLSSEENINPGYFEAIIPKKRRRRCYRIDEEQMTIETARGRSEIYDIITHLTFFFYEADKLLQKAYQDDLSRASRTWVKLVDILEKEKVLSPENLEKGLIYLSEIIGRSYDETKKAYLYFKEKNEPDRFFHIIRSMVEIAHADYVNKNPREINFDTKLGQHIGNHFLGEKWAENIKELLVKKNWINRPLHIISANMHSVQNTFFAHDALKNKFEKGKEFAVYEEISKIDKQEIRAKINSYALKNGMLALDDKTATNLDVQFFDLQNIPLGNSCYSHHKGKQEGLIMVMDYAFGEQAFEVLDELLKPFSYNGKTYTMNVHSISIMGKAGILNGSKGDIMIPSAHIFEGTADNYPIKNSLTVADFAESEIDTYEGNMITVLGTSLQNKDILTYFKDTSWSAIGIEMEGAHYQKAIQIASKIRHYISDHVTLRYAYYASDNPLQTGATLSSGGLGLNGVKPTYWITKIIVSQILSTAK